MIWPRVKVPIGISLVTLSLISIHFWLRWPALFLDYFHNEDSAGITYSADLILRGGLPLIDTIEMKAPGSFFLLAGWWSCVGRSLQSAQLLVCLWSLLAALGVGLGTWVIYRHIPSALFGMSLYIFLSPFTDSIDINYHAWMITPYIWASVLLFWSIGFQSMGSPPRYELKTGKVSWSWLGSGVLIALSALMKRQGAALCPLALYCIVCFEYQRWRALKSLTLGMGITFILFFSLYVERGAVGQAAHAYFFSKSGWSYVSSSLNIEQISVQSRPALPRLWDGVRGIIVHVPLSALLALLALSLSFFGLRSGETEDDQKASLRFRNILLGWLVLSFAGAALGLRFFKGYYLQLLPGFIWIGAAPHVYKWDELQRKQLVQLIKKRAGNQAVKWGSLVCVLASLICLPDAARNEYQNVEKTRFMRSRPLYPPTPQIRSIGLALKKRWAQRPEKSTTPLTLWVWGRRAWPAYYYSEGYSPTRYFKTLGVLTTQLNNTWNPKRRSDPARFNPQSPWPQAIDELKAEPPQYIILSHTPPARGFTALSKLLRERYRPISFETLRVRGSRTGEHFSVYELRSP